jgi:hypothetical protein
VITYTRRAIRKEAISQLAYFNTCGGQGRISTGNRAIGALTVDAMETNYNRMEITNLRETSGRTFLT